ncbi:MAG: SDR family oxidoreductase [Candidatus Cryptobacteroides sp.]|jgi:NAD(P)-dependent dehydrogenase (short-subunit alcohol dehydrogenase family)
METKKYSFDDLCGRNCVITGGFGVIGTALTRGLAAVGVNLAVISRSVDNPAKGRQIAEEFGVKCIGISASTLDKEALDAALVTVHEQIGPVDILVNCAGGNAPNATCKVEQISREDDLADTFYGLDISGFDWVFDLNFKGTLLATMVFTRDMVAAGKGNVLNISSMNSIRPLTKIPAYSAAKGAINNFTQWYAVHVAQLGIRCNAIAPGFFLTEQNRFLLTDEKSGALKPRGRKIIANTPTHKFGEPEDLVGATLYLLSDLSSFVTGVILPIDGGYSAFGGV